MSKKANDADLLESFGLVPSRWRITKERLRRGWGQKELAAACQPEVSAGFVTLVENGLKPFSFAIAAQFADALSLRLEDLSVCSLADLHLENAIRSEYSNAGSPRNFTAAATIDRLVRERTGQRNSLLGL